MSSLNFNPSFLNLEFDTTSVVFLKFNFNFCGTVENPDDIRYKEEV